MQRSTWIVSGLVVAAAALAAVPASAERSGAWLPLRDGTRVKTTGDDCVYLVDGGRLRPMTLAGYQALYGSWSGIVFVESVPSSLVGERIDEKTRLIKTADNVATYLVDSNGTTKRVIDNRWAFEAAWGFWWSKVKIVPQEEIDRLANGPIIE
jgi:hypothetical protein